MIQRNINPKPRFVTLISNQDVVGSPDSVLWRTTYFRFPQDSVIHWISVNSTFTLPITAPTFVGYQTAAISFNNGQANLDSFLNPAADDQNWQDGVIWRDQFNAVGTSAEIFTESKSTQVMMNEFFCHTDTTVAIYQNGTASGININATICFNPIAEWVNFREPTIGVRI